MCALSSSYVYLYTFNKGTMHIQHWDVNEILLKNCTATFCSITVPTFANNLLRVLLSFVTKLQDRSCHEGSVKKIHVA